jgi:hypothetical protein
MKFQKLRLNGLSTITFPITAALPSDRYILKNADGLGPPPVDVTIADALTSGGVYQGRRPQSREVVLTVGLNPNYSSGQTASDLRAELYGLLTPGSADIVHIELLDGSNASDGTDVLAMTDGYVSKLEIRPFSQTPEVQITIPCLQPYLEAPTILYVEPGGSKLAPELVNSGTAPTGFHMEIVFTSSVNSWALLDANGRKMAFDYNFGTADKLVFDTRPGKRGVWLVKDGVTTNIIYALSTDSKWFMLYGGINAFTASSSAYDWGDVYFQAQYWGV